VFERLSADWLEFGSADEIRKSCDVGGQRLGFLQHREMAASIVFAPQSDVGA
jgi:hypothetical protein